MFRQLIRQLTDTASTATETQHDMRQVSVQLLLEVARSDTKIDDAERAIIVAALLGKSELSETELDEMMSSSEQAVDTSISFYQHVRLVNDHFNHEQKCLLIEQMWQVAYADGKLDAHEEAFIRQIADLVYIKHRDFMQAKHRVMGLRE